MKAIRPLLLVTAERKGKGDTSADPVRMLRQLRLPDGTLLWQYDMVTGENYIDRDAMDRLCESEPTDH